MTRTKYLDEYSKEDLLTEAPEKNLIYKQKVHKKQYFESAFAAKTTLDEVWNDIHVFTYKSMSANNEVLLLGPIVLEVKPRKILGFKSNKAHIRTNLEGFVEMNGQTLDQSQIQDAKKALLHQIIDGDMPWEYHHINAIHTQNNLNHALNLIGTMLPEVNGDNVKTISLKEAFERIYSTQ